MSVSRSNNASESSKLLIITLYKGQEYFDSLNAHSIKLLQLLFSSTIHHAIFHKNTEHLPTLEIAKKIAPLTIEDEKILKAVVDYALSGFCQFKLEFYCRIAKIGVDQYDSIPAASGLLDETISLSKKSSSISQETATSTYSSLVDLIKQHQKKILIDDIDSVIKWINDILESGYFVTAINALALIYQYIEEDALDHESATAIDTILKSYIMSFIKDRALKTASDKIGEKVITRILAEMWEESKSNPKEDDEKDIKYALLEAFRAGFADDINLLNNLKFIDYCKTDINGFTALHFCLPFKLLPAALVFTTKDLINQKNLSGATALHIAAKRDDIRRIKYLIANGADPNIKDNKDRPFWMIQSRDRKKYHENSLALYKEFEQNGKVLRYEFPKVQKQGCCGLNAALIAYLLVQESSTLENSTIVARASDIYQSDPYQKSFIQNPFSLRKLAKEKGLTVDGAMGATGISIVLKEVGCENRVITTVDEAHFIMTIKTAIDNELPIIVSFAVGPGGIPIQANENSKGHWATIVGYDINKHTNTISNVLVAQFDGHYKMNIHDLFISHFNKQTPSKVDASLTSQKEYWCKNSLTKEWTRFATKPDEKTYTKHYETNTGMVEDVHLKVVSLFKPNSDVGGRDTDKLNRNITIQDGLTP